MKNRELTQDEKNLIIDFLVKDYGTLPMVDKNEILEVIEEIKDDVNNSPLLRAIDTKFGVYIVFLTFINIGDGFIDKTLSEFLIKDGELVDVEAHDYIN